MRVVFLPALFGLTTLADTLASRNFPHLIIPLNADFPNIPMGTQTEFEISKKAVQVWSATSWDVPYVGANWCSLNFDLNLNPALGAPWELWGVKAGEAYLITITELPNDSLDRFTNTWNFHPAPKPDGAVGTLAVYTSGASNLTWTKPIKCQEGQVAQFLLQPAKPEEQPYAGIRWYELNYTPPHGITYDLYKA